MRNIIRDAMIAAVVFYATYAAIAQTARPSHAEQRSISRVSYDI